MIYFGIEIDYVYRIVRGILSVQRFNRSRRSFNIVRRTDKGVIEAGDADLSSLLQFNLCIARARLLTTLIFYVDCYCVAGCASLFFDCELSKFGIYVYRYHVVQTCGDLIISLTRRKDFKIRFKMAKTKIFCPLDNHFSDSWLLFDGNSIQVYALIKD